MMDVYGIALTNAVSAGLVWIAFGCVPHTFLELLSVVGVPDGQYD